MTTSTAELIRDLTPSKLVALHNAIVDSVNTHGAAIEVPNLVNRFSDRAAGLKRVSNLIQQMWEAGWKVEVDGSGVLMRIAPLQAVVEPSQAPAATTAPADASAPSSGPVEAPAADDKAARHAVMYGDGAPAAKRRGAAPDYEDHETIRLLLQGSNPKRRKSKCFARFALYRDGMTVADYAAAVGNRRLALADLHWDAAHGYISISTEEEG